MGYELFLGVIVTQRCWRSLGVTALIALGAGFGFGAPGRMGEQFPVIIDGAFDDWEAIEPILRDPPDAPGAAVDLRELRVQDDPTWIYFALSWDGTVNAQGMPGSVRILLDADGDPATGARVGDLAGVDAVVELSRRDRPRGNGYGSGNGLRPVTSEGRDTASILPGALGGLTVAPTHAASRIELRVRRGTELPGVRPLFLGSTLRIQVLFETESGIDDRTDVATHAALTPASPVVPLAPADSVARQPGQVRVVAWNVSGTKPRDEPEAFGRVIAALAPDVILLDEVWETVTEDAIRELLAPIPGEGPWNVHVAQSGGRQKTVVASRHPVRAVDAMRMMSYPPGALDSLVRTAGLRPRLAEIEERGGLAMTGAWVTLEGREVLFVPFDLQSAGYAGSPEDRLRVLQVTILRDAVREALRGARDSLVILGGDVNLVGSDEPLRILEADGRQRARLVRLADGTLDTWRNPTQDIFTPGRLDYLIAGGAGLRFVRGFPFESAELDPDALQRFGLRADDAVTISDHLPLVGDFQILR